MSESGSDMSEDDRSPQRDLFSDEEPTRRSGAESGDEKAGAKKTRAVGKPKKKGPVQRQMLSEEHLTGKNGLLKLEEIFKDFRFRGEGYEKQDLDALLHKYEYWCHNMHPKFPFAQVLERIEFLGMKRRPVKNMVRKIRMDMISANSYAHGGDDDTVRQKESDDDGEFTPREDIARVGDNRGADDEWQDIPDDDDDLFASIDVGAVDSSVSISNTPQNSSDQTPHFRNEAGDISVSANKSKTTSKKVQDSDSDKSDTELLSRRSKTNKTTQKSSFNSDDEPSTPSSILNKSQKASQRIVSSDEDESRPATTSSSLNKYQKASQRIVSSDEDEDDLLLATNSQKESKIPSTPAHDTPTVLKSNSNKQNTSNTSSHASSKRRLAVTESDSEDESLLSLANKKQEKPKVKPKQKRASVKLPKKVISPKKSQPVKRRRVAQLDDDDSRSSTSTKPDISASEESDNEVNNTSVAAKKRRVLLSSDDDEDTSLLKTSKEKPSQRRRVVSDSEDD